MRRHSFDDTTELFLSNAPTVPDFEPMGDRAPWRPRPAMAAWVVGAMLVCATILATAFLPLE